MRRGGRPGGARWRRRLRGHDRLLLADQPAHDQPAGPYPDGWYFARFAEDLRRGQVVPVEFMGRKFALFRTRSGEVGMVAARCCHMGADLSRCGEVVGERLVCGYHAWEFGVDGRCDGVPMLGEERIPATASQESLPVIEYAGNVWFWWGDGPAERFEDVSYFDSRRYLNLKGEVHLARSDPLPIIEHIADISHFPHNHKAAGSVEYAILANEGRTFEFQLRPAGGADATRIQTLFRPFALITMAAPCTGIYRTQTSAEPNRTSPLLTMLLGVTPVRRDLTIFTWRIGVRKLGPDWLLWPLNQAIGRLMWTIIRRNVHVDLEVLKWMEPPPKTLWVRPDGTSVREFRRYYERNIARPDELPVAPADAGAGVFARQG